MPRRQIRYAVVGLGHIAQVAVLPAFGNARPLKHRVTLEGETRERRFARRDQFAPELLYFSDCILQNRAPEPGADEGLADVRERPSLKQEIRRPPLEKPEMIFSTKGAVP